MQNIEAVYMRMKLNGASIRVFCLHDRGLSMGR